MIEDLINSPEIAQAKQVILKKIKEASSELKSVCPPSDEKAAVSKKIEASISEMRGRGLYYPYLSAGLGNGALVGLADGSVKYDLIGGIGVHYFGHSHPAMIEAALDAAIEDTLMQGHLQQNPKSEEFSRKLLSIAARNNSNLKHVFLSTSGAMANENALKIVMQKNSPANRILTFEKCFAGRTLATASLTDNPANRKGIEPTVAVDRIPFYDAADPEGSRERSFQALKKLLHENKGSYAAMFMELIQGEGGFYPGSKEYFMSLINLLKEEGVAVVVDEIQTFGRNKSLFAFHEFGLSEYVDVVTVGKMSQVCATLFSEDYNPQAGLLSQTFSASTASLYAGCVILDELTGSGYEGPGGKIETMGLAAEKMLSELSAEYPDIVKGPFGYGTMNVFTYKSGDAKETTEFAKSLFLEGLIVFIAGREPSRIRMLLPVGALSEDDFPVIKEIIKKTIGKYL